MSELFIDDDDGQLYREQEPVAVSYDDLSKKERRGLRDDCNAAFKKCRDSSIGFGVSAVVCVGVSAYLAVDTVNYYEELGREAPVADFISDCDSMVASGGMLLNFLVAAYGSRLFWREAQEMKQRLYNVVSPSSVPALDK